jgi:DNA-binding transcriptional MocR family regulator
MKLYQSVAQELEERIRHGSLRPGDHLPSIRVLCQSRKISPATALHAYASLEAAGLVESRARSGYFVARKSVMSMPRQPMTSARSTRVEVSDLVFETLEASSDRGIVPLGSAFPSPSLFPWKKLARSLGSSARHMDPWSTVESLPPGSRELRRQISRRYLRHGMAIGEDDIIVTAGALEALNLSLQAVTRPGDTIVIESPAFYGCLQAAERLGLRVVEIPCRSPDGMDLGALARAIAKYSIRACWAMTTLHHPTGATAPAEKKRELVNLLASHDIPLIEDDAYGELQFAPMPVPPAKAFDRQQLVLHCGSFSKCLAPGYRLGWVAAGRFMTEVNRRKIEFSLATSLPIQQGVADVLRHGGYDAHLGRVRCFMQKQQALALASIRQHFPADVRVAAPAGGYFLWIECDCAVDSLEVHQLALQSGITLAPGPMFSARRQYRNYIRLNYGHPWTAAMEKAVARIGKIVARYRR